MSSDAEICWPEGFMCIGGRSFEWVYANRAEFVKFTVDKMDSPSGLFKQWKDYCLKQNRDESDCKSSKTKDGEKLYEINQTEAKETKKETEEIEKAQKE